MLNRIENALLMTAKAKEVERGLDVNVSTSLLIEAAGTPLILVASHEDTRPDDYVVPLDDGVPVLKPKRWLETRRLAKTGSFQIVAAPDGVAEAHEPLPLEEVYEPEPSRGQKARSLGWSTEMYDWPAQLREGTVSTPRRGSVYVEMMSLSGLSGAPVWTEEGLIGTIESYERVTESKTSKADGNVEEIGTYHSQLTEVCSLSPHIEAAEQIAGQVS